MQLDVGDSEAVKATIVEITEEHGAPTILVNNAGITRDNLMMRMKDEEWADVIGTNLESPLRSVRPACANDKGAVGPHHQHLVCRWTDGECRASQLRS